MNTFESHLSPAAVEILSIGGPASYSRLVVHGGGNPDARKRLAGLKPRDLLRLPIRNTDAGDAVLAGLWLWHDWLDESHTLSQGISSATGSFWHAIMHRREGDFSNAKYWYAKCRNHSALARIAESVKSIVAPETEPAELNRLTRGGFDAYAWVDLAESVAGTPGKGYELAIAIQKLEWSVLFEATVQSAIAGN